MIEPKQFGQGALGRSTALIYTLLVVEGLLLLASLPGLVPLFLLAPDPSNLVLVALFAIPFGPALSAAIYALRRRSRELGDLTPARAFLRGYRLNVLGALQIWLPGLAWLTLIAYGLTYRTAIDLHPVWCGLLVIVGVAATLWLIYALVITSLFVFRARDIARLAVYFLYATPMATLGNAGVVIIAALIMTRLPAGEIVLALLGSVLCLLLLSTCRPTIDRVTDKFTRKPDGAEPAGG